MKTAYCSSVMSFTTSKKIAGLRPILMKFLSRSRIAEPCAQHWSLRATFKVFNHFQTSCSHRDCGKYIGRVIDGHASHRGIFMGLTSRQKCRNVCNVRTPEQWSRPDPVTSPLFDPSQVQWLSPRRSNLFSTAPNARACVSQLTVSPSLSRIS